MQRPEQAPAQPTANNSPAASKPSPATSTDQEFNPFLRNQALIAALKNAETALIAVAYAEYLDRLSQYLYYSPQRQFNFAERLELFNIVLAKLSQPQTDKKIKSKLEICLGFLFLSFHDQYEAYRYISRAAENGHPLAICTIARRRIAEKDFDAALAMLTPLQETCVQAKAAIAFLYSEKINHYKLFGHDVSNLKMAMAAAHAAAAKQDPLGYFVLGKIQRDENLPNQERENCEGIKNNFYIAYQLGLQPALYYYAEAVRKCEFYNPEFVRIYRDHALTVSIASENFFHTQMTPLTDHQHTSSEIATRLNSFGLGVAYGFDKVLINYYKDSLVLHPNYQFFLTTLGQKPLGWLYHFADPSPLVVQQIANPYQRAAIMLRILTDQAETFDTVLSGIPTTLPFTVRATQIKTLKKELDNLKIMLSAQVEKLSLPMLGMLTREGATISPEMQSEIKNVLFDIIATLGSIATFIPDLTTGYPSNPTTILMLSYTGLQKLVPSIMSSDAIQPYTLPSMGLPELLSLTSFAHQNNANTLKIIASGQAKEINQLAYRLFYSPHIQLQTENRLALLHATIAQLKAKNSPLVTTSLTCLLGLLLYSLGETCTGQRYIHTAAKKENILARCFARRYYIARNTFGDCASPIYDPDPIGAPSFGLAAIAQHRTIEHTRQAGYVHFDKIEPNKAAIDTATQGARSSDAISHYALAWLEHRKDKSNLEQVYSHLKNAHAAGLHYALFEMAKLLEKNPLLIKDKDGARLAAQHARDYALRACYDTDRQANTPFDEETLKQPLEVICKELCKNVLPTQKYHGLYDYYVWSMWPNEAPAAFTRFSVQQPLIFWLYHFSDANPFVINVLVEHHKKAGTPDPERAALYQRTMMILAILEAKIQTMAPHKAKMFSGMLFGNNAALTAVNHHFSKLKALLETAKSNGLLCEIPLHLTPTQQPLTATQKKSDKNASAKEQEKEMQEQHDIPPYQPLQPQLEQGFFLQVEEIIEQLAVTVVAIKELNDITEDDAYFIEGNRGLVRCQMKLKQLQPQQPAPLPSTTLNK